MKTKEYLKLYANYLTDVAEFTDKEFERKRDLLDLFYFSIIEILKKEEMMSNRLGIENVMVLEDEKTITYVVALSRPGLLIGVRGETIESVIKEVKNKMKWIDISRQKEVKIDLVETLSKWSAIKRLEEIVCFYYDF